MARNKVTALVVNNEQKSVLRRYVLARETKGCWLYDWQMAPASKADAEKEGYAPQGTPDWARKWYVLKSDYPQGMPGKTLMVTITPIE